MIGLAPVPNAQVLPLLTALGGSARDYPDAQVRHWVSDFSRVLISHELKRADIGSDQAERFMERLVRLAPKIDCSLATPTAISLIAEMPSGLAGRSRHRLPGKETCHRAPLRITAPNRVGATSLRMALVLRARIYAQTPDRPSRRMGR